MRATGVDGCRGGWLAAAVDGTSVTWRWTADIVDVLRDGADPVGIDIPIGLPAAGARACDIAARRLVGPRASSVFPAPSRPVLAAASYADARALLAVAGVRSMSAQAFAIVPAVAQVDAALTPADEARVVEVHPEVSFTVLAGRALPPKRTVAGAAARLVALQTWLPSVAEALQDVPDRARLDDALDALVVAWSAQRWRRGEAQLLGDGTRDARGLLMRIVA